MKLAIIFDDLIQFGGAERLLLAVCEIWPDAVLYTSVVSPQWKKVLAERHVTYKTSFMQHMPFAVRLNRFYSALLLHVLAFESFDLSEYDKVLSISARYAHMIITKPTTCHVSYMNSPGRMFWQPANYFENEKHKGFLKFLSLPLMWLKMIDYVSSQKVDYFIANSVNVQNRINKYYRRTSAIINPCVENKPLEQKLLTSDQAYFLVITRLASWKKVDIAIKACNKLKKNLVIVGDGPDLARLKSISTNYISFKGYVPDNQKLDLISNCTALINTQEEDFGIVPLEVMAYGKPVIAFSKGGVLETIIAGKTGEFFDKQTSESLENVLKDFSPQKYSEIDCRMRALAFDKSIFQYKLKDVVEKLCI